MTTICLMQHDTFPRIELIRLLIVACGMLSHSYWMAVRKLLDIDGNWNMLSCTPIQSTPNMLNGWHVWWVCRPWNNWALFSLQKLCTDPYWNIRRWPRMTSTTMGLSILSRYLFALKLPSLKCNCIHYPSFIHAHTITPLFTTKTSEYRPPTQRHTRGLRLWGRLHILQHSLKRHWRRRMVLK